MSTAFHGLFAATFSPMRTDGSLDLDRVPDVVERLIHTGVQGLYVCGSTGEGPSLSTNERAEVAAAYVRAVDGRIPVIVQVGHNALPDARTLAEHARSIGASAVSATPPSYFKPDGPDALVDVLCAIQEPAAGLPFFYYHIPALTGIPVDVADLLSRLAKRMPDLAGVKFTAPTAHEIAAIDRRRFTVLFGVDEMLLSGLVAGAHGAVGSTYNLMAPLAREIMAAFHEGRLEQAMRYQERYTRLVRSLVRPRSLPAIKAAMGIAGVGVGPTRLPLRPLDPAEIDDLRARLAESGALKEFSRDSRPAARDS